MSVRWFMKRLNSYREFLSMIGFVVILFLIVFITHREYTLKMEPFGTSPGTMVQLQTSHVPTQEDYTFYTRVYPRMVRREITDMTEGDPGELRPWIFPWYGRGVTLIAS